MEYLKLANHIDLSLDNTIFKVVGKNLLQFVNSTWESISNVTSYTSVSFDYRLKCNKYYYGLNCEHYCKERDDAMGHYTCNYLGKRICHRGWKGTHCEIGMTHLI